MKVFYSIVFLILFLLNISGNYVLLLIVKEQITKTVRSKIESRANDISGNLIVKIPMTLPYPPGSNDYEKISGEAEYEGELYHFVKQRFYQDTLYIVCIKDYQTKKISDALDDCVTTFTDQPTHSPSNLKIINTFVKDYLFVSHGIQQHNVGWSLTMTYGQVNKPYQSIQHVPIFHPPQTV